MARDVHKRHKMVLRKRGLYQGRWRKPGDTVELYGDDADRLEALERVEAPKKKAAKSESK